MRWSSMTREKAWKYLLAFKQYPRIPQITDFFLNIGHLIMGLGLNSNTVKV